MAVALCVLGTIDRSVRLGHVNVKTGSPGNGERKKQAPEHGMSRRLCRSTWILSKASRSLGRILWQGKPKSSAAFILPQQSLFPYRPTTMSLSDWKFAR